MYFVVKGEVIIFKPGEEVEDDGVEELDLKELEDLRNGESNPHGAKYLASCTQGGFFGELALVMAGNIRAASAAAYTFSELLILPRHDFDRVLELYPDFHAKMEEMIKAREEQNRQNALLDPNPKGSPKHLTAGIG